jgi:virginiamycin B lyase
MLHGLALLLGVGFPLGAMAAAAGPVAPQAFTAKVTEWQLPKPMFARSSAVAPDGSLYIALPNDNKIVRFDPRTQAFNEWDLLGGHHPNSVLVDHDGTVWTAGYGNGTIGRLKPATGMIAEFSVPSGGGGPHTLALSKDGTTLWFTLQTGDKIGSVVWWCRSSEHKLGRLEPLTGRISELDLGRGSRPRRIATAPDGMLWVTLYGKGQLARVDPVAMKVVKTQALPGGNAGAYSVAVDDAGIVWANEIKLDAVVRFDPATESMRTIKLPSLNVGIRKLTIDGAGRVWYTGSHNGRLGVIE